MLSVEKNGYKISKVCWKEVILYLKFTLILILFLGSSCKLKIVKKLAFYKKNTYHNSTSDDRGYSITNYLKIYQALKLNLPSNMWL